ncbi:hypothetical protein BS50DRAFT_496323 [Corynespora cassiicola Philippines]|uniref:Uncharacterized protein n=1 Tax=Corynespora cassiicola Philippines TaxID=1448308 RepID=A0A2T2NJ87_CORCC|nr:hypothetical protein BS50DRAFT_496323 [Corynespora cassiicola Philippines]
MHPSLLLVGASLGLASARQNPWMYGVPQAPDADLDLPEVADVDAAAVLAASNVTNTTQPQPTGGSSDGSGGAEPCAVVSSAIAAAPTGARKVIPAELGMKCLESVPLDREGNVKLIDDLKLYVQWQSNIAYLKNPPADYTEDPVDMIGEMESMQKQLASGGFANEYEFQSQLMTLFSRAYDNHLAWQPDIMAGVMQFQRPPGTELVSVSADGMSLPEIYAYRDLELAKNDSSFQPSPVRTINGQGVDEYLETVAVQADFHDADTRWNALFPSQALIASGTTYLGSFRTGKYVGPNTTMSFANGTTMSKTNLAVVFGNFTGVDSGETFFQKFCTGPPPQQPEQQQPSTPPPNSTEPPPPEPEPSMVGYPKPVLLNPNLSLGGFHLEGSGYEDVAVLSIPSYESPDVQGFQNVMRDFIRMSKQAKKTKLIFDLRGNGGGNAILGYDSFKQVYPQADQVPFGGTRYRANEVLNVAGQMTESFLAEKTYVQSNETAFKEAFMGTSMNDIFQFTVGFNFKLSLDAQNQDFRNWAQLFGPEKANGDSFTTTTRYNFSDELSYTYPGFSVIGFLNNTNETSTPQPFRAEDMVMLHDGMCSSTCAIVSELLKNQGAVRTIAVGGRPKYAPMQGVGGTKGAQVWSWDDIQVRSQVVYFLGSPEQQAQWNQSEVGRTAFAEQMFRRTVYSQGRPAGGVNLRDNLRRNDASKTPLEFIYEAADCKMFYTAPMVNDVTQVWKGVADRMFRNGTNMCVMGSTGDPSSISGGGQMRSGNVPPQKGEAVSSGASRWAEMEGRAWWSGLLAGLVFIFVV